MTLTKHATRSNIFTSIDEWLLLRYPRVWQTRIHIVLLMAPFLYALVALVGSALALQLERGQMLLSDYGEYGLRVGNRFQSTHILWKDVSTTSNWLGFNIFYICFFTFLLAAAGALFFARGQARYSIEENHGFRSWRSPFVEWVCYFISASVFAGLPLVMHAMLAPSAAHRAAATRIEVKSQAEGGILAKEVGMSLSEFEKPNPSRYPFDTDKHINYSELIYKAGDSSGGYDIGYYDYIQLVVPHDLDPLLEITEPVANSFDNSNVQWKVRQDLNQDQRDYLEDLRGFTHLHAYTQSSGRMPVWFYQNVMFWWVTGILAAVQYLRKRSPPMRTFVAFVLSIVFIPFALFVLFTLFGLDSIFITRSLSPIEYMLVILIGAFITVLSVVALGALCVFAVLRARARKPLLAQGVLLLPTAIGYLPGLLLLSYILPFMTNTTPSEDLVNLLINLGFKMIALMPFVFLPLFPLVDAALTRHNNLPEGE